MSGHVRPLEAIHWPLLPTAGLSAERTKGKLSMQREAKHRVSLIVVTWNNARIIRECLKSLQPLLNCPDVEIIVVDNASSDGTADVVKVSFRV